MDILQVTRLGAPLFARLSQYDQFSGTVSGIHASGFYLTEEDGRPLYFREGKWLTSPFTIFAGPRIKEWMGRTSLKKGDRFFKKDLSLYRESRDGCRIDLSTLELVDLDRVICSSPPPRKTLEQWVRRLTAAVLNAGRFAGLAGVLALLDEDYCPRITRDKIPSSLFSSYAFQLIDYLLFCARHKNGEEFLNIFGKLVGFGPGLTPAGDDFLTGFLASHKILSSRFWISLGDSGRIQGLFPVIRSRTTGVGFELLSSALAGIFPESVYSILQDLSRENSDLLALPSISALLELGHSTGTDMLVGTILGLASIH